MSLETTEWKRNIVLSVKEQKERKKETKTKTKTRPKEQGNARDK